MNASPALEKSRAGRARYPGHLERGNGMNITETLDILNGPASVGIKSVLFFELVEAGYNIVTVNGQWMLVDDSSYERDLW